MEACLSKPIVKPDLIYMAACFSSHVLRCVIDMAGCVTNSIFLICRSPWEYTGFRFILLYECVCVFVHNTLPGGSIYDSKNLLNIESRFCVAKPILRIESLLTSTQLSVC